MFFRTSKMVQLSSDFSVTEDKRVNLTVVQDHKCMLFSFPCKYEWLLNILLKREKNIFTSSMTAYMSLC